MSEPGSPKTAPDGDGPGDFEALLISHQSRIYFFIRSMVFNPEEARDVLQDVNMIIFRKRSRFAAGTDFKSWAFAIARFECMNHIRKHNKNRSILMSDSFLAYLSEGAEERADEMDSWLGALAHCRKRLTPMANRILNLRYKSRVPLEEVAVQWSTTEGALKQLLFRARAQLRKCVLERLSGKNPDESGD